LVEKNFGSLPPITIDKEQMKQVVLNLLLNAIQAMPKGGRLQLSGKIPTGNQSIQLSIQDSGIGIPPEDMDKLFDPFFSNREGGIGLGLSIAHRIIDQHHGRIEVESAPDEGTLFTIWLPLEQENQDADHTHR
jgi:signal transduction histidine kinase